MTRSGLIKRLLKKKRMTNLQAERLVATMFDGVAQSLLRGERVELRGFGTFEVRGYGSYQGRNPRTGQTLDVQPRRLALFRASPMLANRLNQEPSARLVHRGPGVPRKSTGITGVWKAIESDEPPIADEITRRMG
jgi:integration host factor subunit beta